MSSPPPTPHQLTHQWSCLKNNIKIYIKRAPTCFGVNSYTIISEVINLRLLKLLPAGPG